MSQPADRSTREPRRRLWAAALIALTLAGCGATSDPLSHAVSGAARRRVRRHPLLAAADAVLVPAGRRCRRPQADRGAGARCLRQAWDVWLHELRRNGYDPSRVGR